MSTKVRTKKYKWGSLVRKADPDWRRKRVVYEFSNGRKFYAPYDETGRGIYE